MFSLISSENSIAVAAGLFSIVLCGLLAERTELGRKVSAPLIALAGGMLLSNTRILPFESPTYDFVVQYLVPIAIPLLLLNANLKRILRETGPTLVAFLAGTVGTILGAIIGFTLIDIGPETHKIVGVLSATFIGGSFNFVAVAQSLEIEDPTLVASAATAQGVAAIFYLSMLLMAPGIAFISRLYRSHRDHSLSDADNATGVQVSQADPLDITGSLNVPACVTFSLLVCAFSLGIADLIGMPNFGILIITATTVALASLAPTFMHRFTGGDDIGLLLVYVFIAAVGAQSNIWQLAGTTSILVGFLAILLTVHALCVLIAGRLFGLTLPEVVIGSNACAFGASTAAAVAAGKRWHGLVTPGILCGILGYIIANFIGVGLSTFLQSW